MRLFLSASLGLAMALAGTTAAAQGPAPPDQVEGQPAASDRGAAVLGAKVGGLVAFSALDPNARVALELGYVFPFLKRSLGLVLDVGYAAPQASGTQGGDPRVPGGSFDWHLTEQELTFMPTVIYRITALGRVVPYGGVGPRIYLLESTVKGTAGGSTINETTEVSTKVGLGIPLGVQYQLGPGALLGEVLIEYGPLDHRATGDSNTGAASLLLGYRFML